MTGFKRLPEHLLEVRYADTLKAVMAFLDASTALIEHVWDQSSPYGFHP
jgi:hypothetical protein